MVVVQYIGNNPDSRLMRFYGLHAIKMHYGDQVFVIVMSNAFRTHRKIHERYDLKVRTRTRTTAHAHERLWLWLWLWFADVWADRRARGCEERWARTSGTTRARSWAWTSTSG
jgi:hypothetical protein